MGLFFYFVLFVVTCFFGLAGALGLTVRLKRAARRGSFPFEARASAVAAP